MHAEVVVIGSELLAGSYNDINAAFLSAKLAQIGWKVVRHTTLPDDPLLLRKGLEEAVRRSQLVITTGGLGPTHDDYTKQIAAGVVGSELHFDEDFFIELTMRFGKERASLQEFARVPRGAEILRNPAGLAPGLILPTEKGRLVLFPGVPREVQALWDLLEKKLNTHSKLSHMLVHFCMLEESRVDAILREMQKRFPEVQTGLYPTFGTLTISFAGPDRAHVEVLAEELKEHFKEHVIHASTVEKAVHEQLISRKKKLALAESCTGGRIASNLTLLAGASEYFLGSIVVYSDALKQKLLHVPHDLIVQKGAVSEEVAAAMLSGLFKVTEADFGVAVSGIAGPTGGSKEKPIGTICAALGERGKPPKVLTFQAPAVGRESIILFTAGRLAGLLYQLIK